MVVIRFPITSAHLVLEVTSWQRIRNMSQDGDDQHDDGGDGDGFKDVDDENEE